MPLLRDTDVVGGTMRPDVFIPPNGCIPKTAIPAGAGVEYTKVQQQKSPSGNQPNTAATSETRGLWVARGATGTVLAFRAGSIVACIGAATITLDLKKNGTTILSAVLTLNNSSVARVVQSASLVASPNYVVGDWFEVVITATAGGGTLGTGLWWAMDVQEDPA